MAAVQEQSDATTVTNNSEGPSGLLCSQCCPDRLIPYHPGIGIIVRKGNIDGQGQVERGKAARRAMGPQRGGGSGKGGLGRGLCGRGGEESNEDKRPKDPPWVRKGRDTGEGGKSTMVAGRGWETVTSWGGAGGRRERR